MGGDKETLSKGQDDQQEHYEELTYAPEGSKHELNEYSGSFEGSEELEGLEVGHESQPGAENGIVRQNDVRCL